MPLAGRSEKRAGPAVAELDLLVMNLPTPAPRDLPFPTRMMASFGRGSRPRCFLAGSAGRSLISIQRSSAAILYLNAARWYLADEVLG